MSTEIIVEQKFDTIIIDDSPENTILVLNPDVTTIITSAEQGPPGPAGIDKISDASDLDITNLENGSVLVYSESSEKWVATRLLENQNVECGHY